MYYKEERMLAMIAKCDQVKYGNVFDTVGINKYNIDRYQYIYVRNIINDDTHNKARIEESILFERLHRVNGLPESEKSMLGIPALANKLVQMQLAFILKCLPDILKKINERLNALNLELNQLPNNLMSVPEVMATFMHVIGSLKEIVQKMLIQGDYNEYEDDKQMHFNARFLVEEIKVLEETNGIWSSNFPPHSCLLSKKVNNIYNFPLLVIKEVCGYLEIVCVRILVDHYVSYPKLLSSTRKATHNVMEKMKLEFSKRVVEMMEMEKTTDYTCDPDFMLLGTS
ncbi:dynamin-related protein 4C-like [Lactuca sativa]|uniref:dynamin-related protein 4C-like n=1 Tax=Lactuca sativa TaxID=4236 RepID=UPI001C68ED34|nr:dynamin-related protein 4C-like [Lactuca sativa]